MRAGISLSTGLHAGVLAFAVLGLPSLFDPPPPAETVIAVSVVAEAAEPEPKPPKPEEPPPAPEPPKPAPKKAPPPEPPPPPPPPPEPEPVPEAEPEPKPEPRPKPEPKPEPTPQPEPKPKPKPKPKKVEKPSPPQAKPKPAPRKVAKAVPAPKRKPKPPDNFETLLRNLERRKAAAPKPQSEQARPSPRPAPPRQDSLTRKRLISALVQQIRDRVVPCWNPQIGIKDAHKLRVEISIRLNPDGTLIGSPMIVDRRRLATDPVFRAYAESAKRALQNPRCQPLRLPLDSYKVWQAISFNFDTRELLR